MKPPSTAARSEQATRRLKAISEAHKIAAASKPRRDTYRVVLSFDVEANDAREVYAILAPFTATLPDAVVQVNIKRR